MHVFGDLTLTVNGNYYGHTPAHRFYITDLSQPQYNLIRDLIRDWVFWYNQHTPGKTHADAWATISREEFGTYEEMERFVEEQRNWARNKVSRRSLRYSTDSGGFV